MYQALSLGESKVLITHQPHHSWCSLILSPSTTTFLLATPIHHPMTCSHPVKSPSPLLRDVGPIDNTSASSEVRMKPQLSLLFSTGCEQLLVAWRRNGGLRNMRGDPGSGRPNGYIMKTKCDDSCTSFSPIPISHFPPLTILNPTQKPPPTSLLPQKHNNMETQTLPRQHTTTTQHQAPNNNDIWPNNKRQSSPMQQAECMTANRWKPQSVGGQANDGENPSTLAHLLELL